jgi:hypothetical protein
MRAGVTDRAKCDQVRFGVISQTAPKVLVVNFKVRHPAARLTPPAIATQDLLPEALIRRSI